MPRRSRRTYRVPRLNPSEGSISDAEIRRRYEDCVMDVKAKGGTYSPFAVCTQSMRRSHGKARVDRALAPVRSASARKAAATRLRHSREANPWVVEPIAVTRMDGKWLVVGLETGHIYRSFHSESAAMRYAREKPIRTGGVYEARGNPVAAGVDRVAAHELMLFAVNDEPSYRHAQAIMRNMAQKMKRGTYDPQLAVKAWTHWADAAAKKYAKEYADTGDWSRMFSPATRREAAKEAVEYYREEIEELRRRGSR